MPDQSRGTAGSPPGERRLDSWKEIAAYFGREVRTVQRWERRDGLPIHRLQLGKLGSVFAYASELDAWRDARDRRSEAAVQPGARHRWWNASTLVASSIALLGICGALYWWPAVPAPQVDRQVRSLVVLPLEDASEASDAAYFADGITEALTDRLSAIKDLRVISRTSAMQFKESRTPPPQIAKTLGVDAALVGSVWRAGEHVQITARLMTSSGESLWEGSYERPVSEMLALQGELTSTIASRIHAPAPPPERVARELRRPVTAEAYENYLKARFHLNSRTEAQTHLKEAVRYFEQAIERDPTFAPAHAGLASAYSLFGTTAVGLSSVADTTPKVIAAATRALELDAELAEAHWLLAHTAHQAWKWTEAEAGLRRALAINPNDASSHLALGAVLTGLGRTEEGLAYARRGRDLDPLSPGRTVSLAWLLYQARRYDEAIAALESVLAAEPVHRPALWFLGFALTDASRPEEAIQTLERLAGLSNRHSAVLGVLARAYGRAGRLKDARRIVDELERRRAAGYVPPAVFVNAYVGIGDRERAFAAIERACRERSNIVLFLKVHPVYDPVRNDPRFSALLERVGLN